MLKSIHHEIINILLTRRASYSEPLNSEELAKMLHVNPSYLRLQMLLLKKIIGVRRGKHGGYFLKQDVQAWLRTNRVTS